MTGSMRMPSSPLSSVVARFDERRDIDELETQSAAHVHAELRRRARREEQVFDGCCTCRHRQ